MDTVHKIVTEMPLTELWNGNGPLDAIIQAAIALSRQCGSAHPPGRLLFWKSITDLTA
jgi:hypothetical protein